jgi:mannosylfructose-phosphate synthase
MNKNINSILMISSHGYVAAEPELGKPDTGGQVVYVLELAKRFSRLGKHVDLITRRFEDQPEFDEINDNFRIWRIPFGGKKFIRKEDMHDHLANFTTNTLAAIRKQGTQYDIVYSHYWDAGWSGQKIAEELGIPHVHTPHSIGWWKKNNMGTDMTDEEMEKKYRFEERIRKEFLVYQSCDHVIATTEQQRDIIQEHYGVLNRHVSVVPAGIDENRFSPMRQEDVQLLRKKHQLNDHDVLVLGRMAANKGYDLMIRAIPTLVELVPDARLVAAIGFDDSKQDIQGVEELKKLADELNVADKIVWHAFIPEEDLPNYYRMAAVFALPSRYEPFGMVAIEAMACGTPTVTTVHGGLAELIDFGSQALYADPNRPVEFGTMLALPMLYPNLNQELSVEGARFARRNFGWTGIAKQVLEIGSGAGSLRHP